MKQNVKEPLAIILILILAQLLFAYCQLPVNPRLRHYQCIDSSRVVVENRMMQDYYCRYRLAPGYWCELGDTVMAYTRRLDAECQPYLP